MFIYLFLIERVHIVRGRTRNRLKDRMYLIHLVGLIPYGVIALLASVFRVDDLDENGRCLIGVERQTALLVIVYDMSINVYLLWMELTIGVPYNPVPFTSLGLIFIPDRKYRSEESCSTNLWYAPFNGSYAQLEQLPPFCPVSPTSPLYLCWKD